MRIVVFDLDDTLYKEIEFVYSGFYKISEFVGIPSVFEDLSDAYKKKVDAFELIISKYNLKCNKSDLLKIYRKHKPTLVLLESVRDTLLNLSKNCILGIVTDGRIVTQQNKIEALGLDKIFQEDNIIISEAYGSEKPALRNYTYFVNKYGGNNQFFYIGDNTTKDFISPNKLGWTTICIKDDGTNIHEQNFLSAKEFLPDVILDSVEEVLDFIINK